MLRKLNTPALVSVALLLLSAGAHVVGGDGPLSWLAQAMRLVSGVALVLAVPGAVLLPLWRRAGVLAERAHLFYGALLTALSTVGCHAVSHKVITLAGVEATFWPMWLAAAGWLVAAALAAARWGASGAICWPSRRVRWAGLGSAAALVAAILATSPPGLVDVDSYLSEEIYDAAPHLDYSTVNRKAVGLSVTVGRDWQPRGPRSLALNKNSGRLMLRNSASQTQQLRLKLVLQNRTADALAVTLLLDGEPLRLWQLLPRARGQAPRPAGSEGHVLLLPPRYQHRAHPRNRAPALLLVTPTLELDPGDHLLRVTLGTPGQGQGRLVLHDLSNTTAHQFYRQLTALFFIGDTGDILETLDLSRNFRHHWIQHSSAFDGDKMDGGGPSSISDEPPGHHFLSFLALTFIEDRISSISWLWLAELLLLLALVVHLACWDNPQIRWWQLLPLLGLALVYSRLCRLGLESNAPDTLYLLVWLCTMRALLDGRRKLALVLVAVSILIHVPTPQCLVLLAAALVLVDRKLSELWWIGKALAVVALVMGLRTVVISLDGWPDVLGQGLSAALHSGQNDFMAQNRLSHLRTVLLTGDWALGLDLLGRAAGFAPLALLGTVAAIPVVLITLALPATLRPAKLHRRTWVLLLFGLLYCLALSLVNVRRGHHLGPIAFTLVPATVRRLSQLRSPLASKLLVALLLAGCAAALVWLLGGTPDYSGTFSSWFIPELTFRNPD